jgi:hypothetical protein
VNHPVPPAHLPSVPTLEHNCFVHGDDPRNVFPVKIASTESVGTLKDAIKDKKKHVFQHVDADALEIYKVAFPVDDGLEAKLKRFQAEDGGDNRLSNAVDCLREFLLILSMVISMLSYYLRLHVSDSRRTFPIYH